MRELLVADLIREILGPRNGACEEMLDDPVSEYLTGVLAPECTEEESITDIPADPAFSDFISDSAEDDQVDPDVGKPPLLSPAVDPASLPSSFGISFQARPKKQKSTLSFKVALTWSRYRIVQKDRGKISWKREPRISLLDIQVDLNKERSSQVFYLNDQGEKSTPREGEISFHILTKMLSAYSESPENESRWMINMYFVNRIRKSPEEPFSTCCIFQPQIRVICGEDCEIVPSEDIPGESAGEEDEELSFLYRNRPVLARGFLCSAIWKDIDPHQPWKGPLDFPETADMPPFTWIDGRYFLEQGRLSRDLYEKFLVPDVRSEFVPLYSIPLPDMSWPEEYGPQPCLDVSELAESFSPGELEKKLTPLLEGYRRWVESIRNQVNSMREEKKKVAGRLLSKCEAVLERMEKSLELLKNDDEVRLAFCFASKVMSLQHELSEKKKFTWRPFQLGYILTVLESVADPFSRWRDVCDILWVPTGAGKTEAYLFLVYFLIALRRRRAVKENHRCTGTAVITRYTLRLLTIQQFRRLLKGTVICEYLRVYGLGKRRPVGWYPPGYSPGTDENYLWGEEPISAGLWVGGGVTPNRLRSVYVNGKMIPGAIDILKGGRGEGEPAQVTECPVCRSILAIPDEGISGRIRIHLVIRILSSFSPNTGPCEKLIIESVSGYGHNSTVRVHNVTITPLSSRNHHILSLDIETAVHLRAEDIDALWNHIQETLGRKMKIELVPVRASRPGYFLRWYRNSRGEAVHYDFDIFCPSPDCPLRTPWVAGYPLGFIHADSPSNMSPSGGMSSQRIPDLKHSNRFIHVQEAFRYGRIPYVAERIPIMAFTVDEQIYHRIPTVVVSTVDKFARPPFEPRASAIFGNVDHYHCIWGYYRKGLPAPSSSPGDSEHPSPAGSSQAPYFLPVEPCTPPELILQDELHLIDGPLGSLSGFYETAVDHLCHFTMSRGSEKIRVLPKYIASSATVRNASVQVRAIFARETMIFPPFGLSVNDRFFLRDRESHPLQDTLPGRLYIGVCCFARGMLTPQVRIYTRLLQSVYEVISSTMKPQSVVDPYWTLTVYFNSIRELGGARALFRQDVQERLMKISKENSRPCSDARVAELSSRISSTDLPFLLDALASREAPDAYDVLLTTSMFGTGVDIPRISLMVVNGQPKTTSSYIQATGRVGRKTGALVVTLFKPSRPRDLSHYEFFTGYHRQLHRYVEPVTVYPFSPGVLERATGPVCVFVLRNARDLRCSWFSNRDAALMATSCGLAGSSPDIERLLEIFEERNEMQPSGKRYSGIRDFVRSELDRWRNIASLHRNKLIYAEYKSPPEHPVVLGTPEHAYHHLDAVYENAPQSLRDTEETCGFQTRDRRRR